MATLASTRNPSPKWASKFINVLERKQLTKSMATEIRETAAGLAASRCHLINHSGMQIGPNSFRLRLEHWTTQACWRLSFVAAYLTDLLIMKIADVVDDFRHLGIALGLSYSKDIVPLKEKHESNEDITYFMLQVRQTIMNDHTDLDLDKNSNAFHFQLWKDRNRKLKEDEQVKILKRALTETGNESALKLLQWISQHQPCER